MARGVLVQGSAHGHDNSAMLDALEREPKRLRGVAVAEASVPAAELRRWHALGVRALRFNHYFRGGQLHYRGGVTLGDAKILAPLMRELGWHLQLWIDVKDLTDTIPTLKEIGLPVMIDHMGRTDASAGTSAPGFQSLLKYLGSGGCWVKLSGAHRVSHRPPDYPEARAFHGRWSPRTPSDSSGAPTGRIRAWKTRCRTPAICSICSTHGRLRRRSGGASSWTTRRGFTTFRDDHGGQM